MNDIRSVDYETYREIMDELLQPISGEGLDVHTLTSLYESKLVYLENLRVRCFRSMNDSLESYFTVEDYSLVVSAISNTKAHLHDIVVAAVSSRLANRKAS